MNLLNSARRAPRFATLVAGCLYCAMLSGEICAQPSYFLELADGQQTFSGIPDTFPEFQIPARFIVSGTIVESGYGIQRLRLQTGLEPEEAIHVLSKAIEEAGFFDFSTLAGRPLNEFITYESTRSQRTFCRDDVAFLTLQAMVGVGLNDVLVTNVRGRYLPHFSSCSIEAELQRSPGLFGAELKEMMQLAPVLDLPQEVTVISPPVIGNTSISPNVYETSAVFKSDIDANELSKIFLGQLERQSWSTTNSNKESSGSGDDWVRHANDAGTLYTDFRLLSVGSSRFMVAMRVTRLPNEIQASEPR